MKITLPDSAITAIERNSSDSELFRVQLIFLPLDDDPKSETITRNQTIKKSAIKNNSFIIKVTRVPVNKPYSIDITISNSKGNIIWQTSSELYVEAGINNIEMLANKHEYDGSFDVLNYTEERVNRDSVSYQIGGFEFYTHIITYTNKDGNSIERKINKKQIVFEISDEYDYIPYITLQKKYGEDYINTDISTQVFFDLSNNRFGVISDFNDEGSFRLQFTYGNSVTYKYFKAEKIFYTNVNTNINLYDIPNAMLYKAQLKDKYTIEALDSQITLPENPLDFAFDNNNETVFCLYKDSSDNSKIKVYYNTNTYDISLPAGTTANNFNKLYYNFTEETFDSQTVKVLYAINDKGDIWRIYSSQNFASNSGLTNKIYTSVGFDNSQSQYEIQDIAKGKGYCYVIVKDKNKNGKDSFLLYFINLVAENGGDKAKYFRNTKLFLNPIAEDFTYYDNLSITDFIVFPENDNKDNFILLGKVSGSNVTKYIMDNSLFSHNLYSLGLVLKGSVDNDSTVTLDKKRYQSNYGFQYNNGKANTWNLYFGKRNDLNTEGTYLFGPEKIIGLKNNTIFIADSGYKFTNVQSANSSMVKYRNIRQVIALYIDDLSFNTTILSQTGNNNSVGSDFDNPNNPKVNFNAVPTSNTLTFTDIYNDTNYETTINHY
ncbi:MAG: hypothetical protein K6E97_08335 [Treponema sp.]|nr:hypothetical protein [Treponema sp.]